MDFALIAQAATLEARVPFLHFFDGFRTVHEVMKIEELADDDIRAMIDDELVLAHRARAPDARSPVIRGTAQNPDVFFQAPRDRAIRSTTPARTSCRRRWTSSPKLAGRQYQLFDYFGAPDAERVIVHDGLGREDRAGNRRVPRTPRAKRSGLLKVRLFRPFSIEAISSPRCRRPSRRIAVLDRTKEPGAAGEPLYQDVRHRAWRGARRTAAPFAVMPDDHRRPLRPFVEGIHPGDGQGGVRRAGEGASRRTTSRSASTTT